MSGQRWLPGSAQARTEDSRHQTRDQWPLTSPMWPRGRHRIVYCVTSVIINHGLESERETVIQVIDRMLFGFYFHFNFDFSPPDVKWWWVTAGADLGGFVFCKVSFVFQRRLLRGWQMNDFPFSDSVTKPRQTNLVLFSLFFLISRGQCQWG